MSLRDDLATAAREGLILGVKILAVCAVVIAGSGWFIGDYAQTRRNASEAKSIIHDYAQVKADATEAMRIIRSSI